MSKKTSEILQDYKKRYTFALANATKNHLTVGVT